MTASRVLTQARRLGIRLFPKGAKLGYDAPAGAMTPEVRAALAAHKAELLALMAEEIVPEPDGPGRPVPLVALPWRLDLAAWPHREWSRWRRVSGLLLARVRGPADVAAIHRAEMTAYTLILAHRPGLSARLPRPVPWRDDVSTWPIPERERWAGRCDELADRGVEWRRAEALAFVQILGWPHARPPPRPEPAAGVAALMRAFGR